MDIIPWYYKVGALALAVVALVVGGEAYLAHRDSVADKAGYDRSQGEWKEREAGIAEAARAHAQQDTIAARAETAALQDRFNTMADTRQKEKDQHENDKRTAVARALAGVERMHLPTGPAASDPVREVGDSQGTALGSGIAPAAPTYLLPATAAAILDIAGDYGQLVRDYNTVVEQYGIIERACNAGTNIQVTQPQQENQHGQ